MTDSACKIMSRVADAILNSFAALLETTGDYRVLRRLTPQKQFSKETSPDPFAGIILDTETTSMTPGADEVIELGMIKFEYGRNGQIYRVLDTFNQLRQPSKLIPAHITAITGITDGEVAGHAIDPASVEAFVSGAALIIAHNAKFDRPMCEAAWPFFRSLNWACSLSQIPWRDEGYEGTKLGYLLNGYGYFHNGYRAIDDCHALLHLLARPRTKRMAMSLLLDNARKTEFQPKIRDGILKDGVGEAEERFFSHYRGVLPPQMSRCRSKPPPLPVLPDFLQ